MAKCIFCGKEQEDYMGVYLIKNDGSINYYCSGKCRKNHLKLKRDKRKLKWTEAFRFSQKKRFDSGKRQAEKVKEETKEKKEHKHEHKAKKDSK